MTTDETSDMEQAKQHVAGIFGRAAATYDQVGPRFFSHFGRSLVEAAHIRAGSRVLDVATGRGAILFPAAEAVGPDGVVIGIDLAQDMVRATEEELAHRNRSANAEACLMDAENLDFPDESFDYVLCGFAIFFFPHLERALSEFRRVLKRGGHIGVTTWGNKFDGQWQWVDELAAAYLPPEAGSPPPRNPDFGTSAGLASILTAAGFVDVQVLAEAAEFVYATEEECWATWWSHGMRGMLEQIEQAKGAQGLQDFQSQVFQKLAQIKQPDGIHDSFQALIGLGQKRSS